MLKSNKGALVIVLACILSVVAWFWLYNRVTPSDAGATQTPSPTVVVSTMDMNDPHPDPAMEPLMAQLRDRARAYEELYYSFDYKNPTAHAQMLAPYTTADFLKALVADEAADKNRSDAVAVKATKTVADSSFREGGVIGDEHDMAETAVTVQIVASVDGDPTTATYALTSYTSWVLANGQWYAYKTNLVPPTKDG